MKLKVDIREKRLIKLLDAFLKQFKFKNIEIEIENLPLGDVILCDNEGNEKIIVERKSLNDLASSINIIFGYLGRYVEQSHRLMNNPVHNHNIVYLIEGNLSIWQNRYKVQSNTLYSAIFSLNYYKGFSVIKTIDMTETAEYILRMCDKLNREKKKVSYYETGEILKPKNYSEVVKKVKKENITPENIGEIILSQIPGVRTISYITNNNE